MFSPFAGQYRSARRLLQIGQITFSGKDFRSAKLVYCNVVH